MIIKSIRQVDWSLNVDSSEVGEISVEDLPGLLVGNWRERGLDCNLDRNEKTSDGSLDLEVSDDDIFASEVTLALAVANENPEEEEEGEYMLENDLHT